MLRGISRALSAGLGATLLLALGAGCRTAPAAILVVVDTNYEVRRELTTVTVTASMDNDASVPRVVPIELLDRDASTDAAAQYPVPFSFVVVPSGSSPNEVAVIEVHGSGPGVHGSLRRRAVVPFVAGQTLRLGMFLARECENALCPSAQTCTERGCESDHPTVSSVTPGTELDGSTIVQPFDVLRSGDVGGDVDATVEPGDAGEVADAGEGGPQGDADANGGGCVAAIVRCQGVVCPSGRCSSPDGGAPDGGACDPLGDERDGPLGGTMFTPPAGVAMVTTADAGITLGPGASVRLPLAGAPSGFSVGGEALLYIAAGPGIGTYSPLAIECVNPESNSLVVWASSPIFVPTNAVAQVVPVPHFTSIGPPPAGTPVTIRATPYDGHVGGVVALRATGIANTIIVASGFAGGDARPTCTVDAVQPGLPGHHGGANGAAGPGGGGPGCACACTAGAGGSGGGGGGANVTAGGNGGAVSMCGATFGTGGSATTLMAPGSLQFGTGGGSGGGGTTADGGGAGGSGGGVVFAAVGQLYGGINVRGSSGGLASGESPGGAGAGGSVLLVQPVFPTVGNTMVFANGGLRRNPSNCGTTSGFGGDGSIWVYCSRAGTSPCSSTIPSPVGGAPNANVRDIAQSPF